MFCLTHDGKRLGEVGFEDSNLILSLMTTRDSFKCIERLYKCIGKDDNFGILLDCLRLRELRDNGKMLLTLQIIMNA